MRHDVFGEIQFDKNSQEWTGSVTLRLFSLFGLERLGDEADLSRREGQLPLLIQDWNATGPTLQQAAALQHLLDNQTDVFHQALGALFESYKEYTASQFSGVWDWIGRKLGVKPIESAEELAASASFSDLQITGDSTSGISYLLFSVDCDWEPEHGMMVVCHRDKPATWTTPEALELESDG